MLFMLHQRLQSSLCFALAFSRRVSIVGNAVPAGVHHENLGASFYTKESIGGTTGSQINRTLSRLAARSSLRDVVRDRCPSRSSSKLTPSTDVL